MHSVIICRGLNHSACFFPVFWKQFCWVQVIYIFQAEKLFSDWVYYLKTCDYLLLCDLWLSCTSRYVLTVQLNWCKSFLLQNGATPGSTYPLSHGLLPPLLCWLWLLSDSSLTTTAMFAWSPWNIMLLCTTHRTPWVYHFSCSLV